MENANSTQSQLEMNKLTKRINEHRSNHWNESMKCKHTEAKNRKNENPTLREQEQKKKKIIIISISKYSVKIVFWLY